MSQRKADERRRAIVKAVIVSILPDITGFDRSVITNAFGGRMPQPEDFLEEEYTEDENEYDEEEYDEEEYDEEEYDEEEYDEEEYDEEEYDEEEYDEGDTPTETPGVSERLRNELKNSEQYAAGKFNILTWVDWTREAMQPPTTASASAPVGQKRARADGVQPAAPPAKRAAVEVRRRQPSRR
ncbi:hypothetical protein F5X68DRAFT_195715 [Plectosphaerella plurivora]|uniref:Uncharacterized protein n=1 Tax=Plectosphaerella plurivora TaxID=936078 RepID=A0A9P8V189_9PEZI|nr:hypothetical protein F5X68DRAFT_195715 [Plectosphaerella plurivora]